MKDIMIPYFLNDVIARGNAGDGDACFDVAEFFYSQKEYEQAFLWNKKSAECEVPNPNAFFNLGYAYQYGEGTEMDLFAAFEAYEKAAALGLPQAMNNLAYFYESGIAVPRDLEKADALCRQATHILNNLQTELLKLRKQYDALCAEREALKVAADSAQKEEAEARTQMLQTLQELNDLQKKLNAAEALQQQVQRQYEEQLRLTKEKLQDTYERITERYQAEKKRSDNLETENSEKTQLLLQAEQDLQNAVSERDSSNRTADKLIAQKQKDTEKIRELESERKVLQETVSHQEGLIEELRKKKPFIRKRTMLAWLDGWFLLFWSEILVLMNVIVYGNVSGFTVIPIAMYSVATILCWILLKKKKYYWHSAVCLLEACLPMLILLLLEETTGNVPLEAVIISATAIIIYVWLFIISLMKEVE